ncbi:50S ribosomal protein L13 [Candidatus Woesearchaeota archaeon]|jgi:large subunit ribosomal protein L13|nr:50S ribosomal protein L13 [Candidatus Woesearchaeota archaeon]MBT4595744.1 50S ribosomal protein L13 [Candidatus Woesearchaeota archaeon]MBT5741407.1 50S ribosomal protein L13 [Candidatus Woesearchaeota archaeon]MBT6505229.1 50S ribosomal protein L13 [Candidatus Woesearchaeota archaeon]MBT7296222.1 50S ribosomal protein L13 [Candidatus Woesearchaeota archaeon]
MIIVDVTNLIIGRFATKIAKMALNGEEVRIVNSQKCVITGDKKMVFAKYKRKIDMGKPEKGPFVPKQPDRLLKRMIRGMLPHKTSRGREALSRIKCFKGIPVELNGKETISIESASMDKSNSDKYVLLESICKHLGAKL